MNYERASSIPSGLIGCRFGKKQLRIEEITPCSVILACDTPLPDNCPMEFSFYQPESGAYRTVHTNAHKDGQTPGKIADGSVRFIFEDDECAAEIRKTLHIWSEYVNIRLSSSPECFAEKYLGYPENTDDYFESVDRQYDAWFSGLSVDPAQLPRMEFTITLDMPSAWKAYIAYPMPEFLRKYTKTKRLPEGFFDSIPITRLYIGSEHCFHLFPDDNTLAAIISKAENEHISLSFCTSIVHQSQIDATKQRLDAISVRLPHAEIIVNDWGMLNILQSYRFTPVLGTILNRFRRDSRLQWKAGIGEKGHLLMQNALNDPSYLAFLESLGVQRFEYACNPQMDLPCGAKSLHFPLVPTNTSAYCPLKAYIETGSRGSQAESSSCTAYCENNAFLYPSALNMIHRMRSIFAAEAKLPELEYIKLFDRLVFNF